MAKLKLALYWAATCGGCDVAVLDLNEKILDVAALADIVFWPIALDFKKKDVEALPDKSIDVCLFNGGIRNSENEEMAHLLRKKSKGLVAFGSCSSFGGIPGLGNVSNKEGIFKVAYKDTPTTDNPEGIVPQPSFMAPEGELTIPAFFDTLKTLNQVVPVEYFVPGCPPVPEQVWAVVQTIASGKLPPPPAVVGASDKTLCEECKRKKEQKKVKEFKRPHLVMADPEKCLLEQGIICMGPATRGGCGARCINANLPCRGCYGPPPHVTDQGAKFLSAVASIIDADKPEDIQKVVDQIKDPLGTFYRFGLPNSLLRRAIVK